jgi:benzoyl-CoA reductase/2-hydroxyglutaryl-CoA dehydratase subunit BcrC/BadD/HgdB
MSVLDKIVTDSKAHPARLRMAKQNSRKLVGYTGRFVPEEIIRAAGAIPHYLCRGGEPEAPEAVLPYMLRFMSPYSRAQIGYHLMGMDPVMKLLDVIVAQCDDCHMSRLADLLEYFKLPTFRIGVPTDWDKQLSFDYYHNALIKFRHKMADIVGNPVTDESLRQSVISANETRTQLNNISGLRIRPCPPISGCDFIRVQHAAFYGDTTGVIHLLKQLYTELSKENGIVPANTPRIVLAGHVVASGDYTVARLIEEAGAIIVAEFLDEGVWHHEWNVAIDGDPLLNLARTYYRERIPPTGFQPAWDDRIEWLTHLIREYKADGVVWYQLSFEEIYDMECAVVSKKVNDMGLPFLKLESAYEYSREAMAPLLTRIESFIKSIEVRRE